MQTVFSERLLVNLRTHNSDGCYGNPHITGRPSEVAPDESIDADPDDRVDPDDRGPRLIVTVKEPVGEIYALPAAQLEQTSGRHPDTGGQSNAPQSPPGAPAAVVVTPPPDLLDPAVLATMPAGVAAFMLYEPRDPPPWRTSLPPTEGDDGSWCG